MNQSLASISSSADPAVSRWLIELRAGDEAAAGRLWRFLRSRLLAFARTQPLKLRAVYDEEDVAQSAFAALVTAMQKGRHSDVVNRQQLWRLLVVITLNKARNRLEYDKRQRRGGMYVEFESASGVLKSIIASDPSPDVDLAVREECERLIGMLECHEIKLIAILRVEGYTNDEIASKLGCTRRTVQRRLNFIRDLWQRDADEQP